MHTLNFNSLPRTAPISVHTLKVHLINIREGYTSTQKFWKLAELDLKSNNKSCITITDATYQNLSSFMLTQNKTKHVCSWACHQTQIEWMFSF